MKILFILIENNLFARQQSLIRICIGLILCIVLEKVMSLCYKAFQCAILFFSGGVGAKFHLLYFLVDRAKVQVKNRQIDTYYYSGAAYIQILFTRQALLTNDRARFYN